MYFCFSCFVQDETPVVWSKVEVTSGSAVPSKRSGHTTTVCGQSVFLFGGIDLKSPPGPSNDVFSADLQPKGMYH